MKSIERLISAIILIAFQEIATRISVLYTGNILATAFAGLIAAGIFNGLGNDEVGGLTGW